MHIMSIWGARTTEVKTKIENLHNSIKVLNIFNQVWKHKQIRRSSQRIKDDSVTTKKNLKKRKPFGKINGRGDTSVFIVTIST